MQIKSSTSHRRERPRVTFLQPSYAPYRDALFSKLASIADIKVIYTAGSVDPDRVWAAQAAETYRSEEPKFLRLNIIGKSFKFSMNASIQASKDADVIVTCTNILEFPTYILSAIIARLRNIPVICLLTVSDDYKFIRDKRFYGKVINYVAMKLIHTIVRLSDLCICYSKSGENIARRLKKKSLSSSQYYPLEEEYGDGFSSVIEQEKQPFFNERVESHGVETLKVCILGYVSPRKGLAELLSMIERLDLAKKLELVVAGPIGSDNHYGQALTRQFGNTVKFVGSVNSEEKIRLLQKSDIMIFPTLHDSWGYVVNEAMYCGVPVIASTKSEAAKDLIQHGVNGWVYSSDFEFLSAIRAAQNPEILMNFSFAAHRDVKSFNKQCFQNWMEAILTVTFQKEFGNDR